MNEQRMLRLSTIIKDVSTVDWKGRVDALQEIRGQLPNLDFSMLRPVIGNIVKQIGDGRSIVMQEACLLAGDICTIFGKEPSFESVADAFLRASLPIVSSSTKVMSDAAKSCLRCVVSGTSRGYQICLERFIQGCTATGKAASYRVECVNLLSMCIIEWDSAWLSRGDNVLTMQASIRKSLRDADLNVRVAAKECFVTFSRKFPQEAQRSFSEMEAEDRVKFQECFPQQTTSAPTTTMLLGSVKRTPHHKNLANNRSVVKMAPLSAMQPPDTSTRKPLRAISQNTVTPSKMNTKDFDLTTVKKSEKKKKLGPRERISHAIVDCFGNEDNEGASDRRISAMREMAAVFVTQGKELLLSDFISSIHAIESCVKSTNESICAAGMDAFGTFMFALSNSKENVQTILIEMLKSAFPVALKRSRADNLVLSEAARRASGACIETCPHSALLSSVVSFQRDYHDDSVLSIFIQTMRIRETGSDKTPRKMEISDENTQTTGTNLEIHVD